ncbi:2078_t:CDS:1, partial [Funneliformis mosseae]
LVGYSLCLVEDEPMCLLMEYSWNAMGRFACPRGRSRAGKREYVA